MFMFNAQKYTNAAWKCQEEGSKRTKNQMWIVGPWSVAVTFLQVRTPAGQDTATGCGASVFQEPLLCTAFTRGGSEKYQLVAASL